MEKSPSIRRTESTTYARENEGVELLGEELCNLFLFL